MKPADIVAKAQLNLYKELMGKLKGSADKLKKLYPDWVPNNDARISWFVGANKTLAVTQIELLLVREYLSRTDWWRDMVKSGAISGDLQTVPHFLEEYDVHIRLWTFHSVFFQLEESLRRVIQHLGPETYAKHQTNWAKLYSFLLNETGLSKFDQLFKLIAYVRNTIHNNGVFRPPNKKDIDISYDNKTFEFRFDKRIRWLTHDTLRQFILWQNQAMLEIMESSSVGAMCKVERFNGE